MCLKEKYDAQNRQFLLQQEYNENTSKQFDVLRMNNQNGYDVQRRLIENQRQMQSETIDYAANRQRSRSPIPLELNPVYRSSHVSRKESEIIGQPLRDISDERNSRKAPLNRD